VADEVRNLAMRASEAAKNTSALIENTIKAVKRGNELTLATQEAFKKNVEISGKIGKLIEEIAAASQEQAQGVGQINKAVAEMDKVVQQNAANAEESAAAAEQMSAQSQEMHAYVSELSALVGGNGSRNGKGVAPCKGGDPSLGARNPGGALSQLKSKVRNALPTGGRKGISPEMALPFDDKDFKKF